jgi:group I intron endonuclease
MIIYKVINTVNNKIYIGQTTRTLKYRKTQHEQLAKKGKGNYFHKALIKYGLENFIWNEIDTTADRIDLDSKEQYWIEYYHSNQKSIGYNLSSGGRNAIFNAEARNNMSKAQKGKLAKNKHPLWRNDLDENKIVELRQQGYSMDKIASILKCSRRAIENRLKMFNNEITSKETLKVIRKDKTKEQYKRPDIKGFSCTQLLEMRKTKTVKQISEETQLSMRMIFRKTKNKI